MILAYSITLSSVTLSILYLFLMSVSNTADFGIFQVTAQRNTTTAELSEEDIGRLQNLSSGVLDRKAEITRQDLDPILNNLFAAREKLLGNNITGAFDAVNLASGELFKLNISLAASEESTEDIQLYPLQKRIEQARSSLLKNNSTLAITYLNGADTQFIILSQKLSAIEGISKAEGTK